MSSVTIRVDQETKTEASRIAEDFGFDLSSITRAFYRQIVREQRIPLNLSYPRPNTESQAALRAAEEFLASGASGQYKSAEDVFKALDI
ncbi:type II toxin-antitoxin system RelB/DinJ family antitoxin [Corynebacterium hindlerae]|uniref:type II toxin-antitoxin system RelB/DinJ family antitoxin n=1 Tax=Corynebacterium hindlerae TaxID=699041 RepID=UPI003AAE54CA